MSNAPAIANHVASRAGKAVSSCATSPYAPPSERRNSTDAGCCSRNDDEPVDRVVVEAPSSVLPADEAGHRLLGVELGGLHQDVGIVLHAELPSR